MYLTSKQNSAMPCFASCINLATILHVHPLNMSHMIALFLTKIDL
jgi:hypothetical protein